MFIGYKKYVLTYTDKIQQNNEIGEVNMSNMHSKLSALAVFSELYDNRKDIYYILWDFSKCAIKKREMWQFTPSDLSKALIEDFDFNNIPEAVYKTLLRKQSDKTIQYVGHDNGEATYRVMPDLINEIKANDNSEELSEQTSKFNMVVCELYSYFHNFEEYNYITNEQVIELLNKYLLGEHLPDDIVNKISEFVFKSNNEGKEYDIILNQIKEGFVIYDGICWSDNLNELGNWKYPITLYYNMDIIFYMAGYSGTIFKNVYDEMHELIKEINGKSAKNKNGKVIRTKFFPEVRKQIDNYFDCAEKIVCNEKNLDAKETAMHYIVTNGKTPSGVKKIRAELEDMLNAHGIVEDTKCSFYNLEQYANNIESESLIEKYTKGIEKYDKDKVERCIRRINYINMLRNGRTCDKIENCEYLLITRNRLYTLIDHDKESRLYKQFSRVLTPENLTSMFWFQLNKGFGKKNFPKSLDVLAQAKIIIAHQVGKNLASCYDRLLKEREKGTITEEQAVRQVAQLRQISTLPEEISLQSIAESCNMKEASVEDMIQSQIRQQEEQRKKEEYIRKIEEDNIKLKEENKDTKNLVDKEIAVTQELEYKVSVLQDEKQKQIDEITLLKQELFDKEKEKQIMEKKNRIIKQFILWSIFSILVIVVIVSYLMNYEMVSKISSVLSIIDVLVNILLIIKDNWINNERFGKV